MKSLIFFVFALFLFFGCFTQNNEGDVLLISENESVLAPELTGISGYINVANDLRISNLRDKVVLLDFWTYSCINCIRTLPHLKNWHDKYENEGLVIIGVHSPEFEFEKNYDNVLKSVTSFGIRYPVVLDNDFLTWRAYNNQWWPHKYLIDKNGKIRYHHIGEGAYNDTELVIRKLLGLSNRQVFSTLPDITPTKSQSPELYAGYLFNLPRGQDIGNLGGLRVNQSYIYAINGSDLVPNKIYLIGEWESFGDKLLSKASDSRIIIGFLGSKVNIVADSFTPLNITVFLNGLSNLNELKGDDVLINSNIITVNEPRLYEVINGDYDTYVLELRVGHGFSFNAFTFG